MAMHWHYVVWPNLLHEFVAFKVQKIKVNGDVGIWIPQKKCSWVKCHWDPGYFEKLSYLELKEKKKFYNISGIFLDVKTITL